MSQTFTFASFQININNLIANHCCKAPLKIFIFTTFLSLSLINGSATALDKKDDLVACDNNNSVCVRKCCPLRYDYINKTCLPSSKEFENDFREAHNFSYKLIFGHQCKEKMGGVWIYPGMYDSFDVIENGELLLEYENDSIYKKFDEYCIDYINTDEFFSVIFCSNLADAELDMQLYFGMIISMPFLLATFLVYAALPDRNLHQKALMFYVFSLLMAYILLVTIQLSQQQFEVIPCKVIGFATVFFFMVSFFWMNVICIDIWFTFSGSRGFIGSQRASERRRFLFYCLYSWGMSFLQVLIVVLINEYGNEEADYYPGVGIAKCFISDGLPTLLYFYGQVAIIISVNVILFSMTAYKIRKVKKETSMLKNNDSKRHSYEKDKQKFNLYLKLLFAMGVNWSMEIISWAVNWKMGNNIPHYVWYLTDFCNAIYGVFIFFIFVFKKKIWRQLQKRYYSAIGRPHLAHSLTTTQTTRASNYSSGNYSTAETGFNSDNRTTLTEIRSTVDGTNGLRAEERPLNRR